MLPTTSLNKFTDNSEPSARAIEGTFHLTQNGSSLLLPHKDQRGPQGPRGMAGGQFSCPSCYHLEQYCSRGKFPAGNFQFSSIGQSKDLRRGDPAAPRPPRTFPCLHRHSPLSPSCYGTSSKICLVSQECFKTDLLPPDTLCATNRAKIPEVRLPKALTTRLEMGWRGEKHREGNIHEYLRNVSGHTLCPVLPGARLCTINASLQPCLGHSSHLDC